jgi:FkbM family methyltransferase
VWRGPKDASLPPGKRVVCDALKTHTAARAPTGFDGGVDTVLAHLVASAKKAKETHHRPVTVLDVGANAGQTAATLARAGVDRVVSFEPHPRTCAAFLDAAARLPNTTRVDLVCSGVGAAPGLAEFVEVAESTSFMERPAAGGVPKSAKGRTMVVPVLPLAAAADGLGLGLRDVAVLKTDTQGREAGVLVGYGSARLVATPHVVLEFSYALLRAAGTDHAALLAYLADAGFACSYMAKHVIGGTVPWPRELVEEDAGCVPFDAFTAAVKGGWTNLWCVNGRQQPGVGGGSGGGGDGGGGGHGIAQHPQM